MINITIHYNAPEIALHLKNNINLIDNIKDYTFVIQLNYRENHTICHLKQISNINFNENFIEIIHKNGSTNYYNYNDIREYHIIKSDEISDLWGDEI